ncbi:hypothetical protein GYMLUDRAFT_647330 [Collybiopsis luxurians FD-317 M1]|nr:hypothetical protein GYMLUDRAFT_647330 [Collybiopsis luxurians FD-317 M1]
MVSDTYFLPLFYIREEYYYAFLEPPTLALGYPHPDNVNYTPWEDPTLSPEEIPATALRWFSLYHDHPCYDPAHRTLRSSPSIHDLDDGNPRKDRLCTLSSWTKEDMAKGVEEKAILLEVFMFSPLMQQTISELSDQDLFDPKNTQNHFPKVHVSHILGTRTIW